MLVQYLLVNQNFDILWMIYAFITLANKEKKRSNNPLYMPSNIQHNSCSRTHKTFTQILICFPFIPLLDNTAHKNLRNYKTLKRWSREGVSVPSCLIAKIVCCISPVVCWSNTEAVVYVNSVTWPAGPLQHDWMPQAIYRLPDQQAPCNMIECHRRSIGYLTSRSLATWLDATSDL